ncbi:hypothetical protein FZC35_01545 [Candidatus Cytomitobacter indipagum]|uniref:Tetratricopeptide repeat protein n=1 Tax=Candidatus Cytomitobacter indipagum TaxID=2601575 RepID=A0A5C0UDE3_9PROT|nr:hypothetical protein [Candidatus Cytomitobacter indipagum]QEK38055.1 hypothetical protein FZC35_01545 [Candidatus Cytomitobacter indipagum]
MFLVFAFFCGVLFADVDYELDNVKMHLISLCEDKQITGDQKINCEKKIESIRNILNEASRRSLTKKNGHEIYIENIIEYIPLNKSEDQISRKDYIKIHQDGIKLMARGDMNSAYRKFFKLSKMKSSDPCSHYYWMGMIRLKQKKFTNAILHLGQFYKSMIRNKSDIVYRKNEDKMPRSILNIMECLLGLKKIDQAKLLMEFFDSKYANYRKSMHEKYIINEIKKVENVL